MVLPRPAGGALFFGCALSALEAGAAAAIGFDGMSIHSTTEEGRTTVRSRVSLLIVAAVLAASCTEATVTTTTGAAAQTTATSSSPAPPTTVAPPTSVADPVPTPSAPAAETIQSLELPDNFGSDFSHVWDEIQDFIDRMSVNPDPSLVDVIIDPECNCYQFWMDLFSELDENGWHYTGEPVTSQVTVLVENEEEVGLAVTQQVPASSVVDAGGNVVRDEEARVVTSSVALRRDEEGRWRIFNVVGS